MGWFIFEQNQVYTFCALKNLIAFTLAIAWR